MSGRHLKILFLTFAIVIISCFKTTAQSDIDNPKTDTIFTEITLTEDGVSAVDAQGDDWYYDFDLDMFVIGELQRTTTPQIEELDLEPVEVRCVNEKIIKLSISKNITIESDEFVPHDIVVFGRVTVKGWVQGNITSYNDRVVVKPFAQVDGDINAPSILVHDEGIVLGEINETTFDLSSIKTNFSTDGFVIIMIIMSLLAVFIFMVVALIPKKLEVVSECFNRYKVRSTLLGFFFLILMPVIVGLVAITIIGIVVIPFIILLYIFAIILGIASFSNQIGNLVFGRFLTSGSKLYLKILLGFSLFAICWIIGITYMTGASDSELFGIGVFFFVISIIFSIYPVFGGIGASVLTRFGYRPYASWKDQVAQNTQTFTPAPPPMPRGPEIKTPLRKSDGD